MSLSGEWGTPSSGPMSLPGEWGTPVSGPMSLPVGTPGKDRNTPLHSPPGDTWDQRLEYPPPPRPTGQDSCNSPSRQDSSTPPPPPPPGNKWTLDAAVGTPIALMQEDFLVIGEFRRCLLVPVQIKHLKKYLLPTYVVRREGNVFTRVCPSVCPHPRTCYTAGGMPLAFTQEDFLVTARVRSTREGNVLTSVCPSIHPSVCHRGGYPYPIMLCNISQNAMRQQGGPVRYPPGGVPRPPQGVPGPPLGCTWTPPGVYPDPPGVPGPPRGIRGPGTPRGGPGSGTPPGGVWGLVPPQGGVRGPVPPGGVPGQVPPLRPGQKEYSLHGGRYASCIHAGGLSCFIYYRPCT